MTTVMQFPGGRQTGPLGSVVSAEIRALMGRLDVSQQMLARWLEVDQTAVSARLRGATEWKIGDLQRVAEGFGIHPAQLLGGYDGNPVVTEIPIKVRHQGLEPQTRWLTVAAEYDCQTDEFAEAS